MQSTVLPLVNELIPNVQWYIKSALQYLFTPHSLTIVIDEKCGLTSNQVFDAVDTYLGAMIAPSIKLFKVSKTPRQNNLVLGVDKHTEIMDTYKKCNLKWKLHYGSSPGYSPGKPQVYPPGKNRFFVLTFKKKFKETVVNEYLPFVMDKAKEIMDNDKVVKLYTKNRSPYSEEGGRKGWASINLEHPATFETLAMEPEVKKAIIDDLERFKTRKEYYKKVGKAWKRGYLLYGPPGTGKSSLIAAMANYLQFDIYYLEITNSIRNSDFQSTLVSTTNKSIIAIEDIDSSIKMQENLPASDIKWTLPGLMNFIDGLWSSCGDERIIVFTTNNKDHLDPALLRPGRMDMHIHMPYCTNDGFRQLASNYLGINNNSHHTLFGEIEGLIEKVKISPAEVAGELMTSENADIALGGLVNCLKRKMNESNDFKEEQIGGQEAKKMKIVKLEKRTARKGRNSGN